MMALCVSSLTRVGIEECERVVGAWLGGEV